MCVCVRECVCVFACERERHHSVVCVCVCVCLCVFACERETYHSVVCVCVCVRERGRHGHTTAACVQTHKSFITVSVT